MLENPRLCQTERYLAGSTASGPYYYIHYTDMVQRWSLGPWVEILDVWFRSLLGVFNSSPPRVSNPTAN